MPAAVVLELDLTEGLLDDPPADPVRALLARRRPVLGTVVDRLHAAARDPQVRGLVVRLGGRHSLARAQELHDALRAFRATGRPTVAWAQTFGELGSGVAAGYLATAFGEVWLQPSGDVGLVGTALPAVFLRDALDRVGVLPQVSRRKEYKNAPDTLLERGFSDAHREALQRLADSAFEQVLAAVAAGRRLAPEVVRELVDRAPLRADEALAAGLVDHLGYRDEVYASVRGRTGTESRLTFLSRYSPSRRSPRQVLRRIRERRAGAVALVRGSGTIRLGRSSDRGPLGAAIGADTVCAAIRAAVRDDRVRALVLRLNTPGGSYVASDAIWREVRVASDAGKPVVVSMGDVAASGGYFVAAAADRVVATGATLTGSIGVFAGKPVVADAARRLGVHLDAVAAGRHARMFSPTVPFTEDEWQRLEEWLDAVYADFVGKVAAGRRMSASDVEAVARGRVWTGADAHERGLVDELGGLRTAVALARRLAQLPEDAPVRPLPAVPLVRRLSPARSSEDPAAAAASAWGGFDLLAARLGWPAAGPLLMPPLPALA